MLSHPPNSSTVRPSVECWLVSPRPAVARVLLLHAPARPGVRPALWQPVSGGVDPGERPLEAAVREIEEESGMRLPPGALATVVEDVTLVLTASRALQKFVYAGLATTEDVAIDDREHDDHRWVPLDRVEASLARESHRYTWALARPVVAGLAGVQDSGTGSGYSGSAARASRSEWLHDDASCEK